MMRVRASQPNPRGRQMPQISEPDVLSDSATQARERAPRRLGPAVGLVLLLVALAGAPSASAATPGPGFTVQTGPQPTNLSPGDATGNAVVVVQVTNTGGAPTSGGPVQITDTLPTALTPLSVTLHTTRIPKADFGGSFCSTVPLHCFFPVPLPPGAILRMVVHVAIAAGSEGVVHNEALVAGGGAPTIAAGLPIAIISQPAGFGISQLDMTATAASGQPDGQAGEDSFGLTTTLMFNTAPYPLDPTQQRSPTAPKDVVAQLPLGLVGNPTAAPTCPLPLLTGEPATIGCPANTQIGQVTVYGTVLDEGGFSSSVVDGFVEDEPTQGRISPLFNVTPEYGYPAEFGFTYAGHPFHLYASVVPTAAGYALRITAPDQPGLEGVFQGLTLTVFGDPATEDARLRKVRLERETERAIPAEEVIQVQFLRNPTSCTASTHELTALLDSWPQPGATSPEGLPLASDPNWKQASSPFATITGCNLLRFEPSIAVQPDTGAAGAPTGLALTLDVPQFFGAPGRLATPDLRKAVVTLPTGMTVSPSGANGLQACTLEQIGMSSAGVPDSSRPTCPDAAKVGTVEVETPLLAKPLHGAVYLAAQGENPFGSLLALYVVVDDPSTGVLLKLAGEVALDPTTGQVTATFDNNPQLPFSELNIRLKSGPRAPLVTPRGCGTYTTTTSLTPWSAPESGPPAAPSDSFTIDSGCSHGFSPSFSAGTTSNQAGTFTPFTMTMSREDGNQNLNGVQLHMPPGLLGMLSSVQPCPEPLASEGMCGPESLIGHTVVSVGPGSDPYTISGGQVFITGPYKGAPYGLSIAEPAKAGPFDLGTGRCDCVVVRAKIDVDPHTSALTVESDPLPTILDGIPLQLKRVSVTLDRPGFTFNPTSCEPMQIAGTLTSLAGLNAPVSSRFQAANCANLPFKPDFKVSTSGKTSKQNGASLHVHLSTNEGPSSNPQVPSEADIARVDVQLPVVLPSRLTTLQKACTAAQFKSNPAGCPEASFVGTAVAHTPILNVPLAGPAVLVSHGGAAFPDLVLVLQGEGVRIDLVGNADIKKGLTYSRFETVPDAPVTSFDLTLPEGPHSVLAANGNLCAGKASTVKKRVSERVHGRTIHVVRNVKQLVPGPLLMPTTMVAQNGAVVKQTTKIAVSGCAKAKKKTKKAKKGSKASAKHGKAGKT